MVELYALRPPPPELEELMEGHTTQSRLFLRHIRQVNNALQMSSVAAQVDPSVLDGHGPPVFKICGVLSHRIGSLLPDGGKQPDCAQLYICDRHDDKAELDARMRRVQPQLREIVRTLQGMLHRENPYVQQFRSAADLEEDRIRACGQGLPELRMTFRWVVQQVNGTY